LLLIFKRDIFWIDLFDLNMQLLKLIEFWWT